jgi:predicted nucleotidyltransferase
VFETTEAIMIKIILRHYHAVQGIYLSGSYGTADEWPGSDIDIALLLPPTQAKLETNLPLSQCRFDLEDALYKEIDLLNLRQVATVFQQEITNSGRVIYVADQYAVDEFEMLVLSFYQKLNEERQAILESFFKTGRAYAV